LAVGLAGCAPKPLPDWAVSRPVVGATLVPSTAVRVPQRAARDRGPPTHVTPTKSQAELLPFTPEWQAREDEFDRRLRRTMNICRSC